MVKKRKILIADDDQAVRTSLKFLLEKAGFETKTASDPVEIMTVVKESSLGLIILDMNYSYDNTGAEGLDLISKIKVFCPECPIILITAWGSVELAVKGIKAGAYDFVTKPWNNRLLLNTIETAIELGNRVVDPEDCTRKELDSRYDFTNIIGTDEKLIALLHKVSMIAGTNAPVLITGASGTGKELIAEAIHQNSKRKNQPFIKVNLGGLPFSLFESEMFGHKKGAFTDAYADREGRFEMANGGTIFLDEIGELDLASQVKLLRVLQEQSFEPLGDSKTVNVDIRVVCATNRNLSEMISSGLFREDLFYRINLIHLDMLPLRERTSDISLLANHFLKQVALKYDVPAKTISNDGLKWLKQQVWPGNVRELKNLIERTVLVYNQNTLRKKEFTEATQIGDVTKNTVEIQKGAPRTLEQVEAETIRRTIADCENNMSRVAEVLGISRATLYRKLDKYHLRDED